MGQLPLLGPAQILNHDPIHGPDGDDRNAPLNLSACLRNYLTLGISTNFTTTSFLCPRDEHRRVARHRGPRSQRTGARRHAQQRLRVPTPAYHREPGPGRPEKEGPAYDLPIAVRMLLSSRQVDSVPTGAVLLGELSREGGCATPRASWPWCRLRETKVIPPYSFPLPTPTRPHWWKTYRYSRSPVSGTASNIFVVKTRLSRWTTMSGRPLMKPRVTTRWTWPALKA